MVRDRSGSVRWLRLRAHRTEEVKSVRTTLICPWDAIEMVPTAMVAQVPRLVAPPEYIEENWDRLVGTAQRLAELKAAAD